MGQVHAPAHNPVRRNARVGPVVLPAEGRKGEPPAWPLPDRMTINEEVMWRQLWKKPQAVAWEKFDCDRVVARYVKMAIAAEAGDKYCYTAAGQLEDRLGLTPKAMRMLLWVVAEDEVAEKRAEQQPSATAAVKRRIKAVG